MEESISKKINQSSIEVSKNSKGYSWKIKAYGNTTTEIEVMLHELQKSAEKEIKKLVEGEDEETKE